MISSNVTGACVKASDACADDSNPQLRRPPEVLADELLTVYERRAILASWQPSEASDDFLDGSSFAPSLWRSTFTSAN
jgi:hypothetical protein